MQYMYHWLSYVDVCPGDCSGHGVCSTIGDIALFAGTDYDTTSVYAGDGKGVVYSNWDSNSIIMCKCDYGYFGAACELSKLFILSLSIYVYMYLYMTCLQ